jgi:hypothetical protein
VHQVEAKNQNRDQEFQIDRTGISFLLKEKRTNQESQQHLNESKLVHDYKHTSTIPHIHLRFSTPSPHILSTASLLTDNNPVIQINKAAKTDTVAVGVERAANLLRSTSITKHTTGTWSRHYVATVRLDRVAKVAEAGFDTCLGTVGGDIGLHSCIYVVVCQKDTNGS